MYDLLKPLVDLYGYQRFYAEVDVPDSELKFPFVVVWPMSPSSDLVNATGTLVDRTNLTQVSVTGRDADEVGAALDLVDGLLVGKKPTIAGRDPGFIRGVPNNVPIRPNETLRTSEGAPTYLGTALYTVTS